MNCVSRVILPKGANESSRFSARLPRSRSPGTGTSSSDGSAVNAGFPVNWRTSSAA
jgi:hypothetical protein